MKKLTVNAKIILKNKTLHKVGMHKIQKTVDENVKFRHAIMKTIEALKEKVV